MHSALVEFWQSARGYSLTRIGGTHIADYTYYWQEPLHSALWEMDRTKLQEKINLADVPVRARFAELAQT